jgi:hypothetical protein
LTFPFLLPQISAALAQALANPEDTDQALRKEDEAIHKG